MVFFVLFFPLFVCFVKCEYYCYNSSVIYDNKPRFINNNSALIHNLPEIRFHMGYWASQFATQYLGYVFVRDIMGIDVSMYPSNDTSVLTKWNNANNLSYPEFYYKWAADDLYDIALEIWGENDWERQIGSNNEPLLQYILNGDVIDGGASNVYSEIGLYVPQYLFYSNIDMLHMSNLRDNNEIRQMYVNAYTNESDIDWVMRANEINESYQYGYDYAKYNKPMIFCAYEYWVMCRKTRDMVKSGLLGTGLDWDFVTLGSDAEITVFLKDLYSKRLPFIVTLYEPSSDFRTTINDTTDEIMKFEWISMPRNPSNTNDEECFRENSCHWPQVSLKKLANIKLQERLPEIIEFMQLFSMKNSDIDEITNIYKKNAKNISNDHDRWQYSACQWLTKNENIANKWKVDIIRYDCIGQCGFNYYIDTNGAKQYLTEKDDTIGGYCGYSTTDHICHCDYNELYGLNCRDSCPGLNGPFLDDNGTSYSFHFCSNNGICDTVTHTCSCNLGFGGDGCEIIYTELSISENAGILIIILYSLLVFLILFTTFWLIYNKQYKNVYKLSIYLTLCYLIGLLCIVIGTMLEYLLNITDTFCIINKVLYSIGGILAIGPPLLKSYRVRILSQIHKKKMTKIKIDDTTLFRYLCNIFLIELIIVIMYGVSHQINGGIIKQYNHDKYGFQFRCNNAKTTIWFLNTNYLFLFFAAIMLCYFSYFNRDTASIWNEAMCAFYGSWGSLLLFLIILGFNQVTTEDYQLRSLIQSIIIFIAIIFVWWLSFASRIYAFYAFPQKRVKFDLTIESTKEHTYIDKLQTAKLQTLATSSNDTPITTDLTSITSNPSNDMIRARKTTSEYESNNISHNNSNNNLNIDIDKWVELLNTGLDETQVISRMVNEGISDVVIDRFLSIYYQARNEALDEQT